MFNNKDKKNYQKKKLKLSNNLKKIFKLFQECKYQNQKEFYTNNNNKMEINNNNSYHKHLILED